MGGRGSGSGLNGSGSSYVSATSTGGKMVQTSSDQWYGENDNGSWAVVNDAGSSDYNFYTYGSKHIYEVDRGVPDSQKGYADNPKRLYATTKQEAMNYAKGWLKANKGY